VSSLEPKEKATLENLLEMSGGYVSNFSDATIGSFIAHAVGIEFHHKKYTSDGSSKAKKMRELWRIESDTIVADLLDALIEHQETLEPDAQLVSDCKSIVARLRVGGPQLQTLKTQAVDLDAPHLAKAIARLEQNVDSDPELAIGSAKELVETCCKTILSKRGHEVPLKDDLPKLAKATFSCLDLLPDGVASERRGSDAIKQVLRSFASITQGVAELRNLYGTGHGRHGRNTSIQPRHAKLVVGAAATLCTFLMETHKAK